MGRQGSRVQPIGITVPHASILALYRAAIKADLYTCRDALLSGLEPLKPGFACMPEPGAQLLTDLSTLNRAHMKDGSVPLSTWLHNAIALRPHHEATKVFRKFARMLKSRDVVDRGANAVKRLEGPLAPLPDGGHSGCVRESTWGHAADAFVGREKELAALRAALLPVNGAPRFAAVCTVHGMAGVGKSYLAQKFAIEHAEQFPGGVLRLNLKPRENKRAPSSDALIANVARQLGLPKRSDPKPIAEHLRRFRALLHIENADSFAAANVAARVADACSPGAILITGRYRGLGRTRGFVPVNVPMFAPTQSLELFEKAIEQPISADERPAFARLADALGHLPLALSLAAGYLNEGYTPEAFLDLFKREGFHLPPLDPAHPALEPNLARGIVGQTFDLSLALMRRELGEDAKQFFALGYAPAVGFGANLGAAIAGLDESKFLHLATVASLHSLLDRTADRQRRWRLHILLAEIGRRRSDGAAALRRKTDWFAERSPVRSLATWRRLGSEAQAEDRKAGHIGPISEEELRDVLAYYFCSDLPVDADESTLAVDAAVEGYLYGG